MGACLSPQWFVADITYYICQGVDLLGFSVACFWCQFRWCFALCLCCWFLVRFGLLVAFWEVDPLFSLSFDYLGFGCFAVFVLWGGLGCGCSGS